MVLGHANLIISWEENLAEDEMPPKWMWPLPWELKTHMKKVIADRKSKMSSKGSSDQPEESGETWEASDEDIEAWKREHTGGG